MVNAALDQKVALRREIAHLADEFTGVVSKETVDCHVRESLDKLQGARVSSFVPLFVHRFARERLRAPAQVQGKVT
jgi:hypothetical protein